MMFREPVVIISVSERCEIEDSINRIREIVNHFKDSENKREIKHLLQNIHDVLHYDDH